MYKSTKTFLSDLKRDYPERLLKLFEIEYRDEELLDYISERKVSDFYPELFRDGISLKRNIFNDIGSPQIKTRLDNNPITGDMALDQTTGNIMVYDGSIWINVS